MSGTRYRVPVGQYEIFVYRSVRADRVEIKHNKNSGAYAVISSLSGGFTTPAGVEWIEVRGADKAIIMPTDQLDRRVPGRA